MSLFSGLSNGSSALQAQSYALEITGKNIANVDNSNYARERVVFGTSGMVQTPLGMLSMGLDAKSASQQRDAFLDQQLTKEISSTASLESEQAALQRAEASLGESISSTTSTSSSTSGAGISSQLDSFFNSFKSFAASPTDVGERQTLVQTAATLVNTFQQTDADLAQVQSDLDSQITVDTSDINTQLQKIADLNAQIIRFEADSAGSAVDLRDQRQAAVEELASKMSFTATTDSSGNFQILATDTGGTDVTLVSGGTVSNTVAFDGTDLTAGSSTLALSSGSIKGAIDARDGTIKTLRDNLDTLASQLVASVNAAYNPTGATGDFFDASGTTADTIALDSSLTATSLKASDGGADGDNTLALAVSDLASHSFSTSNGDAIDGTFSQFYSGVVSSFGQALSSLNASVENQNTVETLVRTQRDAVSGVNIDEETTNLMKYQRAYQACSHYVSVVDNLLDTVINSLGS